MDANGNGRPEVLEFNDVPDRPVKVNGQDYVLVEMGDEELATWMRISGTRFQRNGKGRLVKQDYDGLQADLIHLCLRTPAGDRVPKSSIGKWKASVLNGLFFQCREMNGLGDAEEEEREKNTSPAATGGGG